MDVREITGLISKAFSEDGLKIKEYTVTCESPLSAHLYGGDGTVKLSFVGSRPVLSITKFITFSVELEELYVGEDGGVIKLKNFPDINFTLDDDSEELRCGECSAIYDQLTGQTDMYDEINTKYSDKESRRLAGKVLLYARAWATMTLESGQCFSSASASDVRRMKKDCRAFCKEQMKSELAGSVVVILLVQLVLPYIIKWIVERVIDRLINS